MPSEKAIRKALGRLVKNGADPYWVNEDAFILLELRCVKGRAEQDFQGEQYPEATALITILRELVEKIERHQIRKLLWILFDFDRDHPESTAKIRRTIAGEQFRDGKKQVTRGTVRQYHEPRALDRLCELLIALERSVRAEDKDVAS